MEKRTPFIGQLTHKVVLYRTTTVQNALGEPKPTLVKVCETFASPDSSSGSVVTEEKVHHVVKAAFTIRKRAGLVGVQELELVCNGMKYKVTHIEEIRRSHLKIHCTDPDAWADEDFDNGGGENPGGGGGSAPVIINVASILTRGEVPFSLQIQTSSNNVDTYAVENLLDGLELNAETGLITGILSHATVTRIMVLKAINEHGTGSKAISVKTYNYDSNVLNPPFDLSVGFVPPAAGLGVALNVFFTIPEFDYPYRAAEIWINNIMFKREDAETVGQIYDIVPGPIGIVVQNFNPELHLEYGGAYIMKVLLERYGGARSEFSEEISFTIPIP